MATNMFLGKWAPGYGVAERGHTRAFLRWLDDMVAWLGFSRGMQQYSKCIEYLGAGLLLLLVTDIA
jgi:hypothetical protein